MKADPSNTQRYKAIERFCADYLEDKLGPAQRKFLEERISKGDAEIIDTLRRLQGDKAKVQQVKSQQERFQEDMQSLGLEVHNDHDEKEIISEEKAISEQASKKLKERRSIKSSFNRMLKSSKTIGSLVLASILMVMVLVLIYLQFERTRLNTKLLKTQADLEKLSALTYKAREDASKAISNYAWFLDLLRQNDLVSKDFSNAKYLSGGKLFFEPNTLKLALVPGEVRIPEGQVISLWSEGTTEKRLVGILDPIKADSLYNQWNTPALIMATGFNLRISPRSENSVSYEDTRSLAQIDIP